MEAVTAVWQLQTCETGGCDVGLTAADLWEWRLWRRFISCRLVRMDAVTAVGSGRCLPTSRRNVARYAACVLWHGVIPVFLTSCNITSKSGSPNRLLCSYFSGLISERCCVLISAGTPLILTEIFVFFLSLSRAIHHWHLIFKVCTKY
jgi:hypothetical protein